MRRVLAAAAAGGAAVAAVMSVGGQATTGPATIRITDVQSDYRVIAADGDGRAGDVEVVHQTLYKPPSSKPIGRADLLCTFVDSKLRQCSGTYALPRGSLVIAGAVQSRLLAELAVVGGTGLYDNATGTLTVTSTGLRPRREVLVFRLAG